MDTASLRIAINTGDVKTANSELDKLTKTSAQTEQSANKVTKSFNIMNTALSSVAAIALAKHFTDSADAMNRLDGRLKLATDSMGEFVKQHYALEKIALDSHAPLQAITDLFIKLNPSMIQLGANTEATNQVVSNFSKGLTLGGAKAQESASAILQFGQAMGSGVLRGEEFNAIMEASPKLMEYMAKGLDVPIGSLRKMAENGELTAGRVSNALLKMTDQINKDFATLPKTVGLAMVDFNTELDLAIQRMDKATGTTAALSRAINDMTMGLKNGTGVLGGTIAFIQDYSDVILGVATAYGVMKTASIAATLTETLYATAKSKTTIATNASTASMITNMGVTRSLTTAQTAGAIASTALGTAMKAIPFVAVASTVAILAASFFDAKSQSDDLADSLSTTADKLAKLSQAQLAFKRQNISLELQDATRQLTTKKLSAGATKGRSVEDQAEIDNLQDYVKQLKESSKDIAQAQTDIRNAKNGEAIGTKKIVAPRETAPIDKKAESAAKKAAKEAQRLAEEEAKIQRGYLDGYADLQAQQAIDQYELELSQIEDLAKRKADSALSFYGMVQSETDKINEKNLLLYEDNVGIFNDEQMQTFFQKWQESIDGVKGGYNDLRSITDTFIEDSLNSNDWTAGLEGTAKHIANVANAFKDLEKQNKKYDKTREKISKSTATDEEKQIAYKEIEEAQLFAQVGAYANLAGAASGFFEEGSKGAKAMQAVSATLGIAQGIQAMISAWGSAPFPANLPAVAATTAAVLPMIGQLASMGGSGGSGGGAGISSSTQSMIDTSKLESEQADFIVDRLDRQIELLESIDQGGTATKTKVALAGSTFEADIAGIWAEIMSMSPNLTSVIPNNVALSGDKLTDIQRVIESLNKGVSVWSSADWAWLGISSSDIVKLQPALEDAVTNFALNMSDVKDTVKDSAQGFKEIFDSLSGTDFYKMRDLKAAYEELGNSIVGNTKDSMLSYISTAVAEMEKLGDNYLETVKEILVGGTINEQVSALKELSLAFGRTFNDSTEEALNFLDSIELVSESMIEINDNVKSVFEDIQSFIDDLNNDSTKNPSVTFGIFSESFNSMIDAIASGSGDMIDISGKAIDNAQSYLDVVSATATASRDVEFAKAMLVNKFSGVIAYPDLTLNNINNTLNSNNAVLVAELQALKFELNSIKSMTINQTATQISTLGEMRILVGLTATA